MPNITRALFLLALFLSVLIYQGIHQLNNPATASVDCQVPYQHLHEAPRTHFCDICHYQITDFKTPLVISKPSPKVMVEIRCDLNAAPMLPELHRCHLRGPPVA